jgi:spore maturation protein CgeB
MAPEQLRIVVAGEWRFDFYEAAIQRAFESLGHRVSRFAWGDSFTQPNTRLRAIAQRIQDRLLAGRSFAAANAAFLSTVRDVRPDVIFVRGGTHLTAASIEKARRTVPKARFALYVNDDPFAPGQSRVAWRHTMRSVRSYDAVFSYRHANISDFERVGARRVRLMRSWYLPERNHPVPLTDQDVARFGCDVVFVGHYENDGRLQALEAIVDAGFSVRLHGNGWSDRIPPGSALAKLQPIRPALGDDYNRALCASKMALCFLSKLNRDTYTRRCFEIPATETLLVAEHTADMETLFREGEEAEFFRDSAELVQKVADYVRDDARRRAVAQAGRRRVAADGHDAASRLREALEWLLVAE